jgi:secreted trypsin-like serine protease
MTSVLSGFGLNYAPAPRTLKNIFFSNTKMRGATIAITPNRICKQSKKLFKRAIFAVFADFKKSSILLIDQIALTFPYVSVRYKKSSCRNFFWHQNSIHASNFLRSLKGNEMSKPTISRIYTGLYYFTGWISKSLVQYSILQTKQGWIVTKVFGDGREFSTNFPTKRAAIAAITA